MHSVGVQRSKLSKISFKSVVIHTYYSIVSCDSKMLRLLLLWVHAVDHPKKVNLIYSVQSNNFSLPFILTSNTITTFSLIDVSVQLLKYSVKVSTTLCKNSMTNSGGTEGKSNKTNTCINI